MGNHIKNALIAAFLAGVIVAPIFGFQMVRRGQLTPSRARMGHDLLAAWPWCSCFR